jgi:serine/threonine-protein kinase
MKNAEAPVQVGDILAGKYRVETVLGIGAMGVVVAAMHVDLHERRAIKFMLPSSLENNEGVERFLREARAVVRLKSQHVAKVQDVGRLDTGAHFRLQRMLVSVLDDLSVKLLGVPVEYAEHDGLVLAARAGDLRLALALVHEFCESADIRLVGLDRAGEFSEAARLHGEDTPVPVG